MYVKGFPNNFVPDITHQIDNIYLKRYWKRTFSLLKLVSAIYRDKN